MTLISNSAIFQQALSRFDALNAQDPNSEMVDGASLPKELLYAQRMSDMLQRYAPQASEALRLAARCQHVQRWKIPRHDYPMTKPGYYQWRNALKKLHAEIARSVLTEVGYEEALVNHVCALVGKASMHADAEAQILEDVVVLVFLESYLGDFVASHADYSLAKFEDILIKTLRKTSPHARATMATLIHLPAGLEDIVQGVMQKA
ncbi:MAG: DUF4202 domain-containing protein [Betaproteobacteria bacterium]|nr:DUF4202 domain-containing protein [Betaproteobacteria bacterium]